MTSKKPNINMELKVAIIRSGKTSRSIAALTWIGEVRLSKIIHEVVEPTEAEQQALARVLKLPVSDLFPTHDEQVA